MASPYLVLVFAMGIFAASNTARAEDASAPGVAGDWREKMESDRAKTQELHASLPGSSVEIKSGDEKRSCKFSHRVAGGAIAFVCEGSPAWLLSTAISWGGLASQWTLVGSDPATGEPRRLPMNEVRRGADLLHAEQPNGNFMSFAPPTESSLQHLPRLQREHITIGNGAAPLLNPYETHHGGGEKPLQKFFFHPPLDGEKPLPSFMASETRMRRIALEKLGELKTAMNPKSVKVRTAEGHELECRRGTPENTESVFAGVRAELSCELFSCSGYRKGGKELEALLHFHSDPQRIGMNGPGTGGPYLFVYSGKNSVKSLPIESISSPTDELYRKQEENSKYNQLSTPQGFEALARESGVEAAAPELQSLHYRQALGGYASNCKEQLPMFQRLEEHAKHVRGLAEKQSAIVLIERITEGLSSRLVPRSGLEGEACHLDGDTYVRHDALPLLSSSLLQARELNPITEEEAQKLFREVESMKDIPHAYTSSGCEARAHIIAERLKQKGYPVQKIWAKGGNLSPYKDGADSWNFHVAASVPVRTAAGKVEWRVLDPTMANKAVRPEEWLRRFQPTAEGRAVWTRWPNQLTLSHALAQTIAFLSPPEVYTPEQAQLPDLQQQADNHRTALALLESNRKDLEAAEKHPSPYGNYPPPKPLVERESR